LADINNTSAKMGYLNQAWFPFSFTVFEALLQYNATNWVRLANAIGRKFQNTLKSEARKNKKL